MNRVVLLALVVGCQPPMMPASTFLDRTLATKAAFDLQCPKAQLRFTDLGGAEVKEKNTTDSDQPVVLIDGDEYTLDRRVAREQGVTGCGRQGSYAYVNGAWVGNGAAPVNTPSK